jgi:hypothetical protein
LVLPSVANAAYVGTSTFSEPHDRAVEVAEGAVFRHVTNPTAACPNSLLPGNSGRERLPACPAGKGPPLRKETLKTIF